MKKTTNKHLDALKVEAKELLKKCRAEWRICRNGTEKHKYDEDPTAFRACQMRYETFIRTQINSRGYVVSFDHSTGKPFELTVSLAEMGR